MGEQVIKEPDMPYALNAEGRMVHVDSVPNGKECNCFCPKCHQQLMAKQGEVRTHHFAHVSEHSIHLPQKCQGYYEAMMHHLAKEIIDEEKKLMLPAYEDVIPFELIEFDKVEVEERNDYKDLQPDIVGETKDGRRIHVEIFFSHKVPAEKKEKLRQRNIECLEIDVNGIEPNKDKLKSFLLNQFQKRTWVNYPKGDRLAAEKRAIEEESQRKRIEEEKRTQERLEKWQKEKKEAEDKRIQEKKELAKEANRKARIKDRQEDDEFIRSLMAQQKDQDRRAQLEEHANNWRDRFYNYRISNATVSLSELHNALDSLWRTQKTFIMINGHETKIIWYEVSTVQNCIYVLHANKGCYGSYPFHLTCARLVDGIDFYKNLGSFNSEHFATMKYLQEKESD